MTDLPYADASFDYVLSFNVIYHGDAGVVGRAVAEIYRVLKPGGLFHGTLLSKRNRNYGLGREIAPDTFVIDGAARSDEHTSELQSLMRLSYAVFCLKTKTYSANT